MGEPLSGSRLSAYGELCPEEKDALKSLLDPPVTYRPGSRIRREGEPEPSVFYMHEGMAVASVRSPSAGRQIVKVHLHGDVMGTPSLPFIETVETITTLSECVISQIALDRLYEFFETFPRTAMLLFLAAQEERCMLMDRMIAMGQMQAPQNLASLFLHLHDRLIVLKAPDPARLEIPLTQRQIADVLGITVVHVNRVLKVLAEAGEVRRDGQTYELLDIDALRARSGLPRRIVRRNPPMVPGFVEN